MISIDHLVVLAMLFLTLGIGILYSSQVSSIVKFSVGDRDYSAFTLFATLVASYIGAGFTFGLSGKAYEYGLVYVVGLFGFSIQQLLVGTIIAPRIGQFRHLLTVGDIFNERYGNTGRLVAGICALLTCGGMLGAQVSATGYVFNIFLGVDQNIGILIGCGIVVLYSYTGGIRAGVATDILQFCLLIFFIPLTAILGYLYVGGLEGITLLSLEENIFITKDTNYLTIVSIFFALLVGETLIPSAVQRLIITKRVSQTIKGTIWSAAISVPFFVIVALSGIITRAMNPNLDPNLALPFLIDNVLAVGIKGLAISSIIAVIMSSADAYLNAGAVASVQDIIKPLTGINDPKKELQFARLSTLLMSTIAIGFALSIHNVLDVLIYSYTFWSPIILVPLIFIFFGKSISAIGFFIAGLFSFCITFIWQTFYSGLYGFDGLVIGVISNLLIFLIFYFRSNSSHSI